MVNWKKLNLCPQVVVQRLIQMANNKLPSAQNHGRAGDIMNGEKAVRYIIEDYIEQHFGDEFLISDLKLLANEIEQQPKQVAIMILDKVSELKRKYLENGICPDCGHEIKFGDKRCLSCGKDLLS